VIQRRRRLPHLYVIGRPLFITFCLRGSLPESRRFTAVDITSGEAFLAMDRLLDNARSGTTFLKQPAVAQIALDSIESGVRLGHYELHAFVIMSNHIHLLITPNIDVSKLMRSLKSASAKRANEFLQRTGQPFWQEESYDRLVRSPEEFGSIRRYIESNPVAAGMVARPEDYAWSSAGRAGSPPQAEGLPYKA
jgi:putative transposase